MRIISIRSLLFALLLLATSAAAYAQIGISISFAPPELPVYEQPLCPGEGYLWTPGYWAYAYDFDDYYWVPGTWVMPPEPELLWTPGYWAWNDGVYAYNEGYWGPEVGFYGGVSYGYGYGGVLGFQGTVERAVGLGDGRSLEAELVGRDPSTDLAVLRVKASGLPAPAWAEPDALRAGHLLLSLSRPGRALRVGLAPLARAADEWRAPAGGKLDRYLEADLPLHPGFSGALVLDLGAEFGFLREVNVPARRHRNDVATPEGRALFSFQEIFASSSHSLDENANGREGGFERRGRVAAVLVVHYVRYQIWRRRLPAHRGEDACRKRQAGPVPASQRCRGAAWSHGRLAPRRSYLVRNSAFMKVR